jgi:hypothetical protein
MPSRIPVPRGTSRALIHLIRALSALSQDRQGALNRYTAAFSNVFVARYFWYLDYLSQAPSQYRNVMLTDVRDVVFLGDPFDFEIGDAVCCFLEDEKVRINKSVFNTKVLFYGYGPGPLVELGDRTTSCAGVTIGTAAAVRAYLTVMVEHLTRLTRQSIGVDQGVHNYIVHKGLVSDA